MEKIKTIGRYLAKATEGGYYDRFRFRGSPDDFTLKIYDGEELLYSRSEIEDTYFYGFLNCLTYRENCYSCSYAKGSRAGDLTIGDFWGIEDYRPELRKEISKGISMIYAHSERAKKLIADMRENMFLHEEPLEHSLHTRQPQLRMPFARNPRRDRFLQKVVTSGVCFETIARREFQRWRYINFLKRITRIILKRY